MAISITWPTGVVFVPKADTTLVQSTPSEIRELNINTFRLTLKDLEDDSDGQVWATTHNHYPTVTVGGVTIAQVVELINGYTVTFEDGQYAVNLTGANSNIADRVNLNQVSIRSANSAGLIQGIDLSIIQELVEGLRPHHKNLGDVYFWDPYGGNDNNNGRNKGAAVKTFARAHTLCQDYHHDAINIVSSHTTPFTIPEPLTITKNFLSIRGVGLDTHIHPTTTTAGGNCIEISGMGVEISSVHIEGVNIAAANCNGIYVTGPEVLLKDLTVEDCTGNGIVISTTLVDDYAIIENCFVQNNTLSGIQVISGYHLQIISTDIEKNVLHGVEATGAALTADMIIDNSRIHNNSGYGLKLNNSIIEGTIITANTVFFANILGNMLDNGTRTTVTTVWDAQISGHLTAGTTGKALSDAGSAGNPWGSPVAGNTNAGTFGELVGKKLLTVGKFLGLK